MPIMKRPTKRNSLGNDPAGKINKVIKAITTTIFNMLTKNKKQNKTKKQI
jgi:hypothetical protein